MRSLGIYGEESKRRISHPVCLEHAVYLWLWRVLRNTVPCARRYSLEADVWSFGILLEELALGRAPMANMSLTSVIMSTLVRNRVLRGYGQG